MNQLVSALKSGEGWKLRDQLEELEYEQLAALYGQVSGSARAETAVLSLLLRQNVNAEFLFETLTPIVEKYVARMTAEDISQCKAEYSEIIRSYGTLGFKLNRHSVVYSFARRNLSQLPNSATRLYTLHCFAGPSTDATEPSRLTEIAAEYGTTAQDAYDYFFSVGVAGVAGTAPPTVALPALDTAVQLALRGAGKHVAYHALELVEAYVLVWMLVGSESCSESNGLVRAVCGCAGVKDSLGVDMVEKYMAGDVVGLKGLAGGVAGHVVGGVAMTSVVPRVLAALRLRKLRGLGRVYRRVKLAELLQEEQLAEFEGVPEIPGLAELLGAAEIVEFSSPEVSAALGLPGGPSGFGGRAETFAESLGDTRRTLTELLKCVDRLAGQAESAGSVGSAGSPGISKLSETMRRNLVSTGSVATESAEDGDYEDEESRPSSQAAIDHEVYA